MMLLQRGLIHAKSRASDNLLATVARGPSRARAEGTGVARAGSELLLLLLLGAVKTRGLLLC